MWVYSYSFPFSFHYSPLCFLQGYPCQKEQQLQEAAERSHWSPGRGGHIPANKVLGCEILPVVRVPPRKRMAPNKRKDYSIPDCQDTSRSPRGAFKRNKEARYPGRFRDFPPDSRWVRISSIGFPSTWLPLAFNISQIHSTYLRLIR